MRNATIGFLVALFLVFAAALAITNEKAPSTGEQAKVERVVDGDTLIVHTRGERIRLRLLNIDAPELARDGRPAQCYGEESADELARLLPEGTTVTLVHDKEPQDQYGRELAGVFKDDVFINEHMVAEGFARPVLFQPNDKFYDRMLAAEAAGRHDQKGMFSACPATP